MSKKILAIATYGGHWSQLKLIIPKKRFTQTQWVTTREQEIVDNTIVVPDCSSHSPLKVIWSFFKIFYVTTKVRPDVVITTGSAVGALAVISAHILSIESLFIDSIANIKTPSLSARISANFASCCLTQSENLHYKNMNYEGRLI